MPETAVHKDDRFIFWQHNIGFSGQFGIVHTIPKAPRKKGFAQCQFGFGIF
jgi:hypothetical protein